MLHIEIKIEDINEKREEGIKIQNKIIHSLSVCNLFDIGLNIKSSLNVLKIFFLYGKKYFLRCKRIKRNLL